MGAASMKRSGCRVLLAAAALGALGALWSGCDSRYSAEETRRKYEKGQRDPGGGERPGRQADPLGERARVPGGLTGSARAA